MSATLPILHSARRLSGIDVLRIGAMMLVTAQHVLSLTENERWSTFRSVNIGQLGVANFLGISALLASASQRPPLQWLYQRLMRLYPPYWLAMIGCFFAAWASRYKQFDFYQVLSQMLGTGLFTHPQNLINVPTWFISLILVCYLGLFLVRLTRWPRLVNYLVVALIIVWSSASGFMWPWYHLIGFFTTSSVVVGFSECRRAYGFLAIGIVFMGLTCWSHDFAYTGISLLSIGVALKAPTLSPVFSRIADYCYEYYLVHGVALILAISALRSHPVAAVVCGVLLALLGAILLKKLTEWTMRRRVPRAGSWAN